jgi:hypothetical protein
MIMWCMNTQDVMMYQRISGSQNHANPLTIADSDCKIPQALSTSFLAAALVLWQWFAAEWRVDMEELGVRDAREEHAAASRVTGG